METGACFITTKLLVVADLHDQRQDLISCCAWLAFTQYKAQYLGNSLWTLKFRGFMVLWRSWWPWCFHCIMSNSKEFTSLCSVCPDRNVEWKFHCTNWLLPMDFFTAINESLNVLSGQLKRLSTAAFPQILLNTPGSLCNLIRAVMVSSTKTNFGVFGGVGHHQQGQAGMSLDPGVLGPWPGSSSHKSSVL